MATIYFEEKGEELLKRAGLTKAEFARRMGIHKQNVGVLFRTKNLETIHRAAGVLGVPFELLVGYTTEPDPVQVRPEEFDLQDPFVIEPEVIPTGSSKEEIRFRQKLIYAFYESWKRDNPLQKRFNINLKDDINIRAISLDETAAHASLSYLSTLAVLQLDAILVNAHYIRKVPSNPQKTNQNKFESIIIMGYRCVGIGEIKMTVGVRRRDKTKIQYCITAIDVEK